MFSPSEGLASRAWIIVLGWFPSRERPLAVESLMVQGVVGLEGSGSVCHRLAGFAVDSAWGQASSCPDGGYEVVPLDF